MNERENQPNELNLTKIAKRLNDIKLALDLTAEVTITNPDGIITYANDKFCELSRYTKDELIGKNHRIIKSGYHGDEVYQDLWGTIKQGKVWHNEIKNKAKDGTYYWADSTIVPFLNDEGSPYQYVAIRKDITKRKEYEEALHKIAYENSLTKLPNRLSLENQLEKLCKNQSAPFAILFIDINDFKFINEHFGYKSGDKVLIELSKKLLSVIEKPTSFISHISGDQFIILLNEIDSVNEITSLASRILQTISRPLIINKQTMYITANIGICRFPNDGVIGENLIEKADIALNNSKKNGKNQFHFFTNIMNVESYKKFTLQNDIRKALMNEEFFIEYQPKVDANSHQIIGAEALVRWEHPEWGTVPPNEFISIAEESGVLIRLGEWILKHICLQIKEWKNKDLQEIPIAVNFSPSQFFDQNMTDMVLQIINETEINPKSIEIEITENGILNDYAMISKKMKKLRDKGISFSIDDFGTGFSNLKNLCQLKFDLIKIDQSFIQDISGNNPNLQITKAIIQLAHLLETKVIAEGVETHEQLSFLKKQKCDYIQGYYFSKPISPIEFEKLLYDGVIFPTKLHAISEQKKVNRRKYFRIELKDPLEGTMTVRYFNNKSVQIGSSPIIIENIGPGGLRFVTKIKFPLNKGLILKITTKVLNENLSFRGKNVWCKEIEDHLYQYGFEFSMDENNREHLLQLLNQFLIKYKKNPSPSGCSFVKLANRYAYFSEN